MDLCVVSSILHSNRNEWAPQNIRNTWVHFKNRQMLLWFAVSLDSTHFLTVSINGIMLPATYDIAPLMSRFKLVNGCSATEYNPHHLCMHFTRSLASLLTYSLAHSLTYSLARSLARSLTHSFDTAYLRELVEFLWMVNCSLWFFTALKIWIRSHR